jgi:hypothetical protein
LGRQLEDFRRQFPQIFFAVYIGVLPATPSPAELAFWLLNHAAFQPSDPTRLNEHAAVLIIDPVARTAGMNVGYALDPHLPRHKLSVILRRIRTPLWHAEYAAAIELAIHHLGKALRHAAQRMIRHHEVQAPDHADFFRSSGLHSLRSSPKHWENPVHSQDPIQPNASRRDVSS